MLIRRATSVFLASGALWLAAPRVSAGQAAVRSTQTDSRWYPWLGCWQSDTAGSAQAAASSPRSTTCVVPVSGSSAVDMLTILHGRVLTRDRLDASGRPHAISGQGCDGFESVTWSSTGHRAYLRADYTCVGGTKGTSRTLLALSPTGDWLHIAEVQSGGGSIVSVDQRRDVGPGSDVPADIARAAGRQRLAVATARAAAAAPITPEEIIDALHNLDAAVVRSWLAASDQRFDFDQHQLLALARAGAPPSVMQTVMSTPGRYQDSLRMGDRSADAYLSTPLYNPQMAAEAMMYQQPMTTMYVCPPTGCYAPAPYSAYTGYNGYPYSPYPLVYTAPIIVTHGFGRHEPFRQPERPHEPVRPGPVGIRPGPVGRRP
jgi:hypothetical protein